MMQGLPPGPALQAEKRTLLGSNNPLRRIEVDGIDKNGVLRATYISDSAGPLRAFSRQSVINSRHRTSVGYRTSIAQAMAIQLSASQERVLMCVASLTIKPAYSRQQLSR